MFTSVCWLLLYHKQRESEAQTGTFQKFIRPQWRCAGMVGDGKPAHALTDDEPGRQETISSAKDSVSVTGKKKPEPLVILP